MSDELQRVVLAAGGTAGHVFPALAIREVLVDAGVNVRMFSDERGLKYLDSIERSSIDVIPSGGLVTGSVSKRVKNLGKLITGAFRARSLLRSFKPDLVIGLGGYPSVGPILAPAARVCRRSCTSRTR